MKDQYGRTIDYLRLSVTDRCNLRCRYCMPEQGVDKLSHRDILSFEALEEIVRAAVKCGIRKVRITGGEPLVRRGILDLCRRISAIDGVEELCMTTNGTLLAGFAEELKQAGVSRLNVSLDTLRHNRYADMTRTGSITDALAGISAARRAGFRQLKVNVVLVRGFNEDEICHLIDLTRLYPTEVRFIELMPVGPCADWSREHFLSCDAVLAACPDLEPLRPNGVAQRYRLPGHLGVVGLIRPVTHHFCFSCDRIRITADGFLKPCLHDKAEISLAELHGEELEQAISRAIWEKPCRHHLESGSDTPRAMHEIGG